jgi:LysM repeat protein
VSIAAAHGTSVNELVQLNHIDDPDIIPVGSTLQLP